jgi:hypothetical protein
MLHARILLWEKRECFVAVSHHGGVNVCSYRVWTLPWRRAAKSWSFVNIVRFKDGHDAHCGRPPTSHFTVISLFMISPWTCQSIVTKSFGMTRTLEQFTVLVSAVPFVWFPLYCIRRIWHRATAFLPQNRQAIWGESPECDTSMNSWSHPVGGDTGERGDGKPPLNMRAPGEMNSRPWQPSHPQSV